MSTSAKRRAKGGKRPPPRRTTAPAHTGKTHARPAAPTRVRGTLFTVFLVLITLSGIIEAALYIGQRRSDSVLTMPIVLSLGIVHALLNLIAAYGVWKWKKWGLYLYAASAVLGVVLGVIAVGPVAIFAGILPVIILAYLVQAHWKWFE